MIYSRYGFEVVHLLYSWVCDVTLVEFFLMQNFVRHRFHSPASKRKTKKQDKTKIKRKSGKGDQRTGNVELLLVIIGYIVKHHRNSLI